MGPYRIFCNHRGERLAWCGFAGRWWFAKLPSAAVIEFPSHLYAVVQARLLPDDFERFAMIRRADETPDGSGVEYVDPKHVTLFVD
jgi:hypothetical protein